MRTKNLVNPVAWLFLIAMLVSVSACKSSEEGASTQEGGSSAVAADGEYLALAPRLGANVQSAFERGRQPRGQRYFYTYGDCEDLGLNISRGISGTGATYTRYGDPKRDPKYKGHGYAKSAAEIRGHELLDKVANRDRREDNNMYDEWINFANHTGWDEMVIVANLYMPMNELQDLVDEVKRNNIKIMYLEADNEMNSVEHQQGLRVELERTNPSARRLPREEQVELAFKKYWDWVEDLEAFGDRNNIPVSVVGTPPAYAFPDMLDPETMGSKANLGKMKAITDRIFNDSGSKRTKRGDLKGEYVSRHRYRQYDLIKGKINERNDDLRRKLEYPLARNYYKDLTETEIDFYRGLYPDCKILFTEYGIRKPGAGAGSSFAVATDIAKFIVTTSKINAVYGEQVCALLTYQKLYGEPMGGLMQFDQNKNYRISPEFRSMQLMSPIDGAPILEVGNGDDVDNQWVRAKTDQGEMIFFYNRSDRAFPIPYSGEVEYLQSRDLLDENTRTKKGSMSELPPNSIGRIKL